MSQGSFRLPPGVVEEMLKQARMAEDADRAIRPAKPVPVDQDEEDLAEEFLNDDPTLSNNTLAMLESQVVDLSGFVSRQVDIRQRIESGGGVDEEDDLSPSRRYGVLSDLMEIEAQLGRVLRLLCGISSRERLHYGEAMSAVMIENAKRKRVKLNDELAESLRETEKGDDDAQDA